MGYAHYFSLRSNYPGDRAWGEFTSEMRTLLMHPAVEPHVCYQSDEMSRAPAIEEHLVQFNGRGAAGCETFVLLRRCHDASCKTELRPYDLAVCCALISAKRHLRLFTVQSDGDWDGNAWLLARSLYRAIFGFDSPPLWAVKACRKCKRKFAVKGHNWGGGKICVKCRCGSSRTVGRLTTCLKCNGHRFVYKASSELCYFCSQKEDRKVRA